MHTALRHYARAIQAAGSLHAGVEVLRQVAHELGFRTAACLLWPAPIASAQDFPPPWVLGEPVSGAGISRWSAEYLGRGKYRLDFGLRLSRESALPFLWSSEYRPGVILGTGWNLSPQQLHLTGEVSRLTGMRGGIVVPIHVANGAFGYVGFPSTEPLTGLLQLWEDCEDHLLGITHRFLDAMAGHLDECSMRRLLLSQHETECLNLLAEGRTLAQAARALGVSPSTVRFHLYSAQEKLGTDSRSHAIARAATAGLLGQLH